MNATSQQPLLLKVDSNGSRLNAQQLRKAESLELFRIAALSVPSMALIGALLLIPLFWMLGASLLDSAGHVTLENYRTLLDALYRRSFWATLQLSTIVTLLVCVIAYPVSYLLAQLPARIAGLLLIGVLLPYWTSALVRTFSWLVLLQRNGIVNELLLRTGLIEAPLALANNMVGATIGMIHVMTPVLIMPLFGSMRAIDPSLMRAAATCGAGPTRAFWSVYFPQTYPGLAAGVTMVFILSLGFYITPALLGGGNVNVLSMQIQTTMATNGDWGLVSALGMVLIVLAIFVTIVVNRALRMLGPGKEGAK